ncbi:fimbrial protein [Serratia proteamaculans]|uniref:fimbrial protein n=1 Tax=Serratia proteamaculans TaxID=28151 RepID=UPI001C5940AA|nr:fimbrial protein [Serratia proteamaculans]WEO87660.1 fimbrial protein [Serratia proteamaculans]
MTIFKPRFLASLLFPGLLMSHAAMAVTVNITGNVLASPCTVETANSVDLVLPDVDMATLAVSGTSTTGQSFDLTLKDCPTSTTKVTATYNGTVSPLVDDSFSNTGTATQVAIWLKDSADTTIKPNTTRTVSINSTTKKATFTQSVRMYSKGKAQAGTVIGNIVVGFTYQ